MNSHQNCHLSHLISHHPFSPSTTIIRDYANIPGDLVKLGFVPEGMGEPNFRRSTNTTRIHFSHFSHSTWIQSATTYVFLRNRNTSVYILQVPYFDVYLISTHSCICIRHPPYSLSITHHINEPLISWLPIYLASYLPINYLCTL